MLHAKLTAKLNATPTEKWRGWEEQLVVMMT